MPTADFLTQHHLQCFAKLYRCRSSTKPLPLMA